jgi:hypothetical protein
MSDRLHTKKYNSRSEKIELPTRLSGLSRAHRMIRTEKHIEIQFMLLCSQIRLVDFKQQRSDRQRNERRGKRFKKSIAD